MKLGRETKIERNFKVMAVITKFVIVRDGVELETVFSTKKEAEAHDKMLDAADEISNLIMHHGADRYSIDGGAIKAIAEYIAENAVTVTKILNSYDNAPGAEQTLWGAVNAVTHSVDFNPSARSVDTRLNGAWFGQGAALKNEAFEMVQDESLLESIIETTAEKIRQTGTSGNDTLAGLAALVDF